jgi:hypothetical protein
MFHDLSKKLRVALRARAARRCLRDTGRGPVTRPLLERLEDRFAPAIITFQQGLEVAQDGAGTGVIYQGTQDTEIYEGTPGANQGDNITISVDQSTGGLPAQGLIRFDNIFGEAPGQIPLGSTINSATLQFYVTSPGTQVRLYRMLTDWQESAGWSFFGGNGVQIDNAEASSTQDAQVDNPATTTISLVSGLGDDGSALRAWANGEANFGWVMINDAGDGWDFDSSENSDIRDVGGTNLPLFANRPKLTVDFTLPTGPGRIQFASATYSVNEGQAEAVITVTRNFGATEAASVTYSTSDGTAAAGSDYTATTGVLNFAAGEISKTFTIPILNDGDVEADETVNLTLSNFVGATEGVRSTATLTIVDNDGPGLVEFAASGYSVNESAGTVTVTVNRARASQGAITVDVVSADGTAVAGSDYAAVSQTLSFADGETSKTVTLTINDDSLIEGAESFTLTLQNPTGGAALGARSSATVTIADDEVLLNEIDVNPPGTDNPFEYVELRGTPGLSLANVYFVSVEGDFGGTLGAADLVVSLGSASLGSNGLLVIKSPSGGFTIPAATTVVTSAAFDNAGGILENGTNSFLIILSPTAIAEGTDLDANNDGVLELPSGAVILDAVGWTDRGTGDIVYGGVSLTQSTGTPDAASRFVGDSTPLSTSAWFNGDLNDSTGSSSIGYSDTAASANLPVGATLTPGAANDIATDVLQFTQSTFSVGENSATLTLTVTRSNSTSGSVTVDFATSDGTATAGADYTAASGTLTFAAGETEKTITVTILNDALPEADETFLVTLSNPTGGGTLGPRAVATVTINDDDSTVVTFREGAEITVNGTGIGSTYVGTQDTELASFTPDAALGNLDNISVDGFNSAGGAVGQGQGLIRFDSIFGTGPGQIPFGSTILSAGVTFNVNSITAANAIVSMQRMFANWSEASTWNSLVNGLQRDDVEVSSAIDGAVPDPNLSSPRTVTGLEQALQAWALGQTNLGWGMFNTTGDGWDFASSEDANVARRPQLRVSYQAPSGAGAFSFSVSNYDVNENGGQATVTVFRVGGASGVVTVDYATSDGTATAGSDYTAGAGTLTFADGEFVKTFTVAISDDTSLEPNETINLTLSNPTGGAALGARAAATVTISENDFDAGLVLNEIEVNPPTVDQPFEYIEIRGTANAPLANVYVVELDGDILAPVGSAGAARNVFDLTGFSLGSNGLLVIKSAAGGHTIPAGTTVVTTTLFDVNGPGLGGQGPGGEDNPDDTQGSNSRSFLLVHSLTPIEPLVDYDAFEGASPGEDGILEGALAAATLIDAVGWLDPDRVGLDFVYGGVNLTDGANGAAPEFNPDALTRFVDNTTPLSAAAWYYGELGPNGVSSTLVYDPARASANLPEGAILTPGGANVIVRNVLRLSASSYSVNEAAGTLTVTVERLFPTSASVTVDYATSDGTATAGQDYTAGSGTLTFGPGETTASFTVAITNDALGELDETFTVTLSNPSANASIDLGTAVVTIVDDDSQAISFQEGVNSYAGTQDTDPRAASPDEVRGARTELNIDLSDGGLPVQGLIRFDGIFGDGAGQIPLGSTILSASLTVFITGPSASTANINLHRMLQPWDESTATWNSLGNGLQIDNNELSTTVDARLPSPELSGLFNAWGSTDNLVATLQAWSNGAANYGWGINSDSTNGLDLVSSEGATVEQRPQLSVRFTPPPLLVQFSAPTFSVTEAGTTATITVNRFGPAQPAVTVDYATSDGSATAGSDYTAASGTLSFAAGERQKTFTILISEDTLIEGPETINLALSNPTGGASLGGLATAVLTIQDNDLLLNELNINPPATDNPFEYVELRGVAAAALTNVYFVSIEGDGTGAGAADMVVDLGAAALGSNGLLVIKSPTGGFAIPAGTTVVTDAQFDTAGGGLENGTVSFLIILSPTAIVEGTDLDTNNDGTLDALPAGAIVIDAAGWTDGGAGDIVYGGVTLTQSSGTPDAASRFVGNNVPLTVAAWFNGDLVDTGAGNASVLYSTTAASANLPVAAVLTPGAANEPGMLFRFATATARADEGATLTVEVTRIGNVSGAADVSYATADGSALAGSDYTAASGTLSFAANETSKTFTVTILDDSVVDINETFTVTLSAPTSGALVGLPGTITVTIVDNDSRIGFFQEGANGYAGTQDTHVAFASPNTSFGSAVEFNIDNADGGGPVQGLIRFDNIFGSGPGQIPFGSTILQATLTINVTGVSDATANINLHRMLVDWSEASTWASLTDGLQLNNAELSTVIDATLPTPGTTGTKSWGTTANLVATIQAWANGAANFGWGILNDTGNGLDVVSSEGDTVSLRPALTVAYLAPPLQVESLTATESGFVARFNQPIDPSPLNLYDQAGALGEADLTVVGAATGPVAGSVVVSAAGNSLTFVKTGGPLAADTYSVVLRSAANGFRDPSGGLLDGNRDGTAGDNYTATFTVNAPAANARTVSLPDLARGYGQPINLPANAGDGLPLTISDGRNVTRVTLRLGYNPALISFDATPFVANPAISGVTASFDPTGGGPGVGVLTFSSAAAFTTTAGPLVLGWFKAKVPDAAPYAGKQALDLFDLVVLDDSATPAQLPSLADDAVHVAAYFGDTNGSGTYNAPDITLLQRLIAGFAGTTGFSAYQLADPVLIADISLNGRLQANDTVQVQRQVVGVAVPNIPALPTGLTPPPAGGPDPVLYVGRGLTAARGQTVTVPVRMRVTDPNGIDLSGLDVVLSFNPDKFQLGAIKPGSLLSRFGFSLMANGSQPGVLIVNAVAADGTSWLRFGSDEVLFTFELTVRGDAAPGAEALNLRAGYHNGRSAVFTGLYNKALEQLVLLPAPTDAADDAVDGRLTVLRDARPAPARGRVATSRPAVPDAPLSQVAGLLNGRASAPVGPAALTVVPAAPSGAALADQLFQSAANRGLSSLPRMIRQAAARASEVGSLQLALDRALATFVTDLEG